MLFLPDADYETDPWGGVSSPAAAEAICGGAEVVGAGVRCSEVLGSEVLGSAVLGSAVLGSGKLSRLPDRDCSEPEPEESLAQSRQIGSRAQGRFQLLRGRQ